MIPTPLSRRRFLAISASAAALAGPAQALDLYQWRGVALGARATITLSHPDAAQLTERARAEIDRLEDIFSLYRPGSALSRLNAAGRLETPPFELLECLGLCGSLHRATAGAFDPTVQPLWTLYADAAMAGTRPDGTEIRDTLALVGWAGVQLEPGAVSFDRPGMALTLNGIAQGYVADRVAGLLRSHGLHNVLVDTGELVAIGGQPDGDAWPVTLKAGRRLPGSVPLRDMALATSAPLGTRIGVGGVGHVLDPRTGHSAASRWSLVSVTAPSAAQADGLSTAGCLMSREAFRQAVAQVRGARIARLA